MNVFVTSDLHLSHTNILKFQPETRLYSSIEEHDEMIIQRWNEDVSKNDHVYILGDFTFYSPECCKIATRMKGKKFLIIGNHDYSLLERLTRSERDQWTDQFEWVKDYHYSSINFCFADIIMFHYPIVSWHRMRYGSYHLHGHCHSKNPRIDKTKLAFDVGIDGSFENRVYNLEDLLNRIDREYEEET